MSPKHNTTYNKELNCYEVELTGGKVAFISIEDLHLVQKHRWHISNSGYLRRTHYDSPDKCRTIFLHRYLFGLDGKYDNKTIIEHANRNRLDCRRSNLRKGTLAANLLNRANTVGRLLPKGISKQKNRYYATFKRKIMGGFNDTETACRAYDVLALYHAPEHSEFILTHYEKSSYSNLDLAAELKRLKALSKATLVYPSKPFVGGACFHKNRNKYAAWIKPRNGKRKHLGVYSTKEEAIEVFNSAANKLSEQRSQ